MIHNAKWIFTNILKTLFIITIYAVVFVWQIVTLAVQGFGEICHDWWDEFKDDFARVWDLD